MSFDSSTAIRTSPSVTPPPSPSTIPTSSTSSTPSSRKRTPTPHLDEALRALDATARLLGAQLGHRFCIDDLKELAHEALVDLLARFDPTRGTPFSCYARQRIRGAILDGLRKQTGLPRGFAARIAALRGEPDAVSSPKKLTASDAELASLLRGVASACAIGWACVRDEDDADADEVDPRTPDDPETNIQRAQVRQALERALGGLGEKEAWIVRRHFLEGIDVQDAAAELGYSKSWGSRLLTRGKSRLKELLHEIRHEWSW
jgi:RNA polymerase sigma factor for flagellar operon FliA